MWKSASPGLLNVTTMQKEQQQQKFAILVYCTWKSVFESTCTLKENMDGMNKHAHQNEAYIFKWHLIRR